MITHSNPIGISVLVFGYNSAPRLEKVLTHISNQKISHSIKWEVILMDNASKDNTTEMGKNIWNKIGNNIPFKTIIEQKEGLVYSRITAIENSTYEYLIFVDDDNLLDSNYLQCACELMSANISIGALGGKIEPVYEVSPSVWLTQIENCLAVGEQGNGTEDISEKKGFVWGAGMVLRKSAYQKLINAGFNFFIINNKKKLVGYGDDYELCLFLRLAGYKIFYSEKLILQHIIVKSRLEWNHIKKLYKKFGISSIPVDSVFFYLKNNQQKSFPEFVCLWNMFSAVKNILYNFIKLSYSDSSKLILLDIKYFEGRFYSLIKSFFSYRKYYNNTFAIKKKLDGINF
ncbi:MAG: glycosyltransferase [Bacteroidetes bacterium]|nr:glycosyltransferase [Bacteroidota bacterium]